jgi:uncharacterized protein (DUF427 family)
MLLIEATLRTASMDSREPGPDHPITISRNPCRVRVVLGGFIVAETTNALTLREATLPPVQYIPRDDIEMDLLERTSHATQCPYKGRATYFTLTAGGLVRENAAWSFEAPNPVVSQIAGHVAFHPNKVDAIEELRD